ncbi:MAG: radical SAM protein [Nitrospirae bacterium RBG_19FT_COMBO_55_12]|nr:MAG: radical SAM protein [Nitrospirae bacterium RBG_19FT_COMBO_55_12]
MLIDTHAHLEMREFSDDRDDVIQRAREAGVEYIVTIGTTVESSRDAVMLADKYDFIYAAIGIHPHEVKDILHPAYEILRHFAQHKKVVAYGEVGLDYHYEHSPRTDQKRKFRDMLREARELGLPVIIHDRDAHEDTLQILSEEWSPDLGGVMHCFSGNLEMANKVIEMGFSISIAGPVTFPKAVSLREVVRQIPIEHMLIETDSPYLAPQPVRGKRNEPAYVRHTAEAIAAIKGLTFDDVARITSFNAMQLFGIGSISGRGRITYPIRNSLYLNITNRCTAACTFCVRYHTDFVKGHNLRLRDEPTAEEIVKEIGDPKRYTEIVFCGYGEPLLRLDVVKAVAADVKRRGGTVRIDTNGHANLIHKRNVLPELAGLVDAVSVSLNAQNAALYDRISQPKFGAITYEAVKDFIREAKKHIPDVTVTVVSLPEVDIEACRKIAGDLGVKFRVREYNVVG